MFKSLSMFLVCYLLVVANISAQQPEPTLPNSGDWHVTQVQEINNCPDDFPEQDRWTLQNNTTYTLDFTTVETLPYVLHHMVAGDDVWQDTTLYTITISSYDQYEVYPNIMTQPYTYRYTVLDSDYITLEYIQTLALSDCMLTIRYDILNLNDTLSTSTIADLQNWSLMSSAFESAVPIPQDEPYGAICSVKQSNNDDIMYFTADDNFVQGVRFGYDSLLQYDLRLVAEGGMTVPGTSDVILVIGNGGTELHYDFGNDLDGTYPTTEWQTYQLLLNENAGWYDPEGIVDTADQDLFKELLVNTSQVWIRGEYAQQTTCIHAVSVGDLDQDDLIAEDMIPLGGLYEVTLSSLSDTCPAMLQTGTVSEMRFSFSFTDDYQELLVWTENREQPLTFALSPYPNIYHAFGDTVGHLVLYSSLEFDLNTQFSDTCNATYSAQWIAN